MGEQDAPVWKDEPLPGTVWVGCCGFPKARATYYRHFNVVEIQQTFYRLPEVATAQRWRAEAPPHFVFTLKAWQLITHEVDSPTYRRSGIAAPETLRGRCGAFRPTPEVDEAWTRTLQFARALHATVVVFQCPARFTPTPQHVADLRAFFQRIERDALLLAWEPRGDWPDALVRALCHELELIHCVDPFQRQPVYGTPAYFRLHGRTGYRYQYTDADLEQLDDWCKAQAAVYCLFNNVTMWEDALRFQRRVEVAP
ncbi:MAG: DUF72 domain-containing protein [Anaerolineae bacterium]|nr:DUF72 domain-containing protein [Anaerolineae bacterium]MDW8071792.1 DUF72 domain-containing protein [Anaerolineae bacterium]